MSTKTDTVKNHKTKVDQITSNDTYLLSPKRIKAGELSGRRIIDQDAVVEPKSQRHPANSD